MADPREIKRGYVKTPQLVQTGVQLPPVPLNLADGDWEGLRRLLEAIRQAVNGQDGVSVSFDPSTITNLIFDKGKLISIS